MQTLVQEKKQRNSLLEILRLCASLWVLYYHGISLIERSQMFSNGRIAVDFFFVLSGFFILNSLKKYDYFSIKGLADFIWKRLKPLSITFGICMIFSIIFYIQFFEGFLKSSIWGYLWYIPQLMLVLAIYFLIWTITKNKKIFNICVIIISSICYVLVLTYVTDYGVFRGIAGVGLGILLSEIPSIGSSKVGKILSFIFAFLSIALIVLLSILAPDKMIQDPICLLLLFPSSIYFCSQIPFSNKYVNYVCSLSLGLYTYQAVARVFEANMIITDPSKLFLLVVALAIVDKVLISYAKAKRKRHFQTNEQKRI